MSVAQGHEEQPPQFNMSRWAAEMSSRTDGRERITNNSQPYKTAETHCWRWLILQTEIWGRTTEKKGGWGEAWEEEEVGRARWDAEGRRTGASGTRHKTICFLLSTEKLCFSEWNPSLFPNTHFLQRKRRKEKLDRRKASAGGKVSRLCLLYSRRFIHLVGLIKCQVEFLDI